MRKWVDGLLPLTVYEDLCCLIMRQNGLDLSDDVAVI